jgi:hypothetical protein
MLKETNVTVDTGLLKMLENCGQQEGHMIKAQSVDRTPAGVDEGLGEVEALCVLFWH